MPRISHDRNGGDPKYGKDNCETPFDSGSNNEEGGDGVEVHEDYDGGNAKCDSCAGEGPSFGRYRVWLVVFVFYLCKRQEENHL